MFSGTGSANGAAGTPDPVVGTGVNISGTASGNVEGVTNQGVVINGLASNSSDTGSADGIVMNGTVGTGDDASTAKAVLSGTHASVVAKSTNDNLRRGLAIDANPNGVTLLNGGGTTANGYWNGPSTVTLGSRYAAVETSNGNGMYARADHTQLRGGLYKQTSLTLTDSGARFSNPGGGAVRVTGVKAGKHDTDAVNFHQFSHAMAQASAIAGVPMVDYGKTFAIGGAVGMYGDAQAVAFGASARFLDHWTVKGALSYTEGPENKLMGNVGVGYSW